MVETSERLSGRCSQRLLALGRDCQLTTSLRAEQFVAPATAPARIGHGIVCSGTVSAEKRAEAAVPTIAFESGALCRASGTLDTKCSTGPHDDQASAYAQSTCPPDVCSSTGVYARRTRCRQAGRTKSPSTPLGTPNRTWL